MGKDNKFLPMKFIMLCIVIQLTIAVPCTIDDFNYHITKCEEGKRKIFFSYTNQCDRNDSASQSLPASLIDIECTSCNKGHVLKYNFSKSKLQCEPCPVNTFSNAGQFRINGDYREWSDTTLNQFSNKCFVFSSKQESDKECLAFSSNGIYIKSNNAYNNNDYDYVAQLSMSVKLVRKGEIRFKYKNENIVENGYYSGSFRFFINYATAHHNSVINSDWKEVRIPLEQGTYSFLWQYIKFVSSVKSQAISLKISQLEIDGVETAALECFPCLGGSSLPMASYCNYCLEGKYFDVAKGKCLECPSGTYSLYKSIGVESCETLPNCTKNSYQRIISALCNTKLDQQQVHYELIQMKCIETKPMEDSVIPCIECPIGKYWNPIVNNADNSKCEECPLNTFTSKPNQSSCSVCEGIMSKVTYKRPENKKSSKMNFDVEIEDFEGELSVSFTRVESSQSLIKETKVDIVVDNVIVKSLTDHLTGHNERIPLKVGGHNVKINSINSILNMVTITNTKSGGGYICRPCSNGSLVKEGENYVCKKCGVGYELKENGQCQECPEGSYKNSNNHNDKCIKCPLFTQPNKQRNHCEPYDVLSQARQKTRINLGKYHFTQANLCKLTNNMCKDSLYGPIKDNEKNLYFISYAKASRFMMDDFTYKFNGQEDLNSFIFQLINDNSTSTTSTNVNASTDKGISNSKIVISLGREISSIKILNGDLSKGVMMTYSNGDKCLEDSTKQYQSVLYLTCPSNRNTKQETSSNDELFIDDITTSYFPKFVKKSSCVYYFEWSSRGACPICLQSQVTKMVTPCKSFNRTVYYTEGDSCIISNTTGLSGRNITIEDDNVMISNTNDKEALKAYNINEEFTNKPNQVPTFEDKNDQDDDDQDNDYPILKTTEDLYIEATKVNEVCYMYDDYDKEILIIIIVIPIVYIAIAIIFICVCCKYRKIQGDYHRLVEDPEATNGDNNNNEHSQVDAPHHIDQEIELGSVGQDKNNKDNNSFNTNPINP